MARGLKRAERTRRPAGLGRTALLPHERTPAMIDPDTPEQEEMEEVQEEAAEEREEEGGYQ